MAVAGAALGVAGVLAGVAVVRGSSGDECVRAATSPGWSVARQWDESLLNAIRRALPAPTVHARNLFHTSVAMWDAWAAYDHDALGVVVREKHEADDVAAAREEAISYAAYRVLEHRYLNSVGAADSILEFDRLMKDLCYPIEITSTEGDSPAELGNRIAAAVIEDGLADGSNEGEGYASDYEPVNPPLVVVGDDRIDMADPNRWQPLQIEHMISQNGIPIENGVQQFIGPHWGHVEGFALPGGGEAGVPIDPGPPPALHDPRTDADFKAEAVEIVRLSSRLDPVGETIVDASPATMGANPLGTNDGDGYDANPVTGEPYEPNPVKLGDFARALTEYWADGPKSETPPGHWNVVANQVSDSPGFSFRIGGRGAPVDRLEWDVKMYLALNGALHDAAVAAWGAKGYYDSARPISMIRYLGSLGQSGDPDGRSYHPDGLPLEPGLIEVVTRATTAAGERHEHLAGHEGEIAVLAWAGNPEDPETQSSGSAWILATGWIPYQQPTFVTPSFAGYVSGHSTFSRAAAEVLTAITGSEFFPGGLFEWTIPAGSLEVEAGPTAEVRLQAATYFDAADQAGISRLYGGIHIPADDFAGRRVGSLCGTAAWELAQGYYSGVVVADG
ncbi:MAG TPA: vanadium-dependent haloperoxidase [Actinomycetota bacterium]|nr:vanadium-dependent haloperoxidase [Actinomycetota bacterium]